MIRWIIINCRNGSLHRGSRYFRLGAGGRSSSNAKSDHGPWRRYWRSPSPFSGSWWPHRQSRDHCRTPTRDSARIRYAHRPHIQCALPTPPSRGWRLPCVPAPCWRRHPWFYGHPASTLSIPKIHRAMYWRKKLQSHSFFVFKCVQLPSGEFVLVETYVKGGRDWRRMGRACMIAYSSARCGSKQQGGGGTEVRIYKVFIMRVSTWAPAVQETAEIRSTRDNAEDHDVNRMYF